MKDTLTAFQIAERNRRELLVREALHLMKERGLSLRHAADTLHEPLANISRYVSTYEKAGCNADALIPHSRNGGRKPLARLSEEQRREVQQLTKKTARNTGKHVATSLALRIFAHSDKCSDGLREV